MKNQIAREILKQSSGDLKADVKLYGERLVEEYNKRLNKQQFIEFMEIVRQSLIGNTLRLGQQIWNVGAGAIDPNTLEFVPGMYSDLFEPYRGTKYDPFNQNARINDLFEQILDEEALAYWQDNPLHHRILQRLMN